MIYDTWQSKIEGSVRWNKEENRFKISQNSLHKGCTQFRSTPLLPPHHEDPLYSKAEESVDVLSQKKGGRLSLMDLAYFRTFPTSKTESWIHCPGQCVQQTALTSVCAGELVIYNREYTRVDKTTAECQVCCKFCLKSLEPSQICLFICCLWLLSGNNSRTH